MTRKDYSAAEGGRTEMLDVLKALAATARTFRNVPKEQQEWTATDDEALAAAFAVIAKAESGSAGQ